MFPPKSPPFSSSARGEPRPAGKSLKSLLPCKIGLKEENTTQGIFIKIRRNSIFPQWCRNNRMAKEKGRTQFLPYTRPKTSSTWLAGRTSCTKAVGTGRKGAGASACDRGSGKVCLDGVQRTQSLFKKGDNRFEQKETLVWKCHL